MPIKKGNKMEDSDTETCIFCKIVNADVNDIPEYDRPFIYNEYFFAIPALGQFIEGYILICPRKHIKNLGLLNSEESQYYNEIKQQIHDLLLEEYDRPPVFFEHGSASYNMRGGAV